MLQLIGCYTQFQTSHPIAKKVAAVNTTLWLSDLRAICIAGLERNSQYAVHGQI